MECFSKYNTYEHDTESRSWCRNSLQGLIFPDIPDVFDFLLALTSAVPCLVTMLIDNFPCDPRRRIEPNLVAIKPARTKLHHEWRGNWLEDRAVLLQILLTLFRTKSLFEIKELQLIVYHVRIISLLYILINILMLAPSIPMYEVIHQCQQWHLQKNAKLAAVQTLISPSLLFHLCSCLSGTRWWKIGAHFSFWINCNAFYYLMCILQTFGGQTCKIFLSRMNNASKLCGKAEPGSCQVISE